MQPSEHAETPCYSARLVRPFVGLMGSAPWVTPEVLRWFEGLDRDARIPAQPLHQLLDSYAQTSGDPYIGVRACREMRLGDAGAIDYAMSSAVSLEDVMRTTCRYSRLLGDPVSFNFAVEGERVVVRHENKLPFSRYVEDFQVCGLLWNHRHLWPPEVASDLDVYFTHEEPGSRAEYELTLAGARLWFSAAFSGFSFDARHLGTKLRSADPRLHDVLRSHADALLGALPAHKNLSERVRELLLRELPSGDLRVEVVAKKLRMSTRTLGRRLGEEHTHYSAVLEDVRKDLGLRHVAAGTVSLADVALLTGFADLPSFYRAFRRWTGMTPVEYRRTLLR